MDTPDLLLVLLLVLTLLLFVISVRVYNNLVDKRARLQSLQATIRSARDRRRQVGHRVVGSVGKASQHEQRVATVGSRRGRRGGALISDNANGWPAAGATANAAQGLGIDVNSADLEHNARTQLHRLAAEYNAAIVSFPVNIIANITGLRQWRIKDAPLRPRRAPRRSHRRRMH